MAIKQYKPTTPGRRGMTSQDTANLTRKKPHKALTVTKKSQAGRSNTGQITVRRRGGGAKRRYRLIDFKMAPGTEGVVESIEYDPNRSARIALIRTGNGKHTYILAGSKMQVGDKVTSGEDADISAGNRLPLRSIPTGSTVYNLEMMPGRGGQLVRSAGARAQLTSKEGDWAHVRLPSGEVRLIHLTCYATLGSVGNEQQQNIKVGKAGRNRLKGKRPSVRGKAMNPADHPMGGGEGKTGPGRLPKTPWGKLAIGKKTRRRKRGAEQIIRKRARKRR